MITAEELAKEIDRLDEASNGPYAGPTELARGLLIFIQSRAARVQGASDGPLSSRLRPDVECAPWVIEEVKKLERRLATPQPPKDADCPSNESPGDSLSLRGAAGRSVSRPAKGAGDNPSPDSPIMKWAESAIADRNGAKDAGEVPMPERPALPLRINRETLTAPGKWTTQEAEVIRAYGNAREAAANAENAGKVIKAWEAGHAAAAQVRDVVREAAGRADAVPVCTCPSGDGSLRHPCPQHPPAEPAARAQVGDLDSVMRARGFPCVSDALGYSRNFAYANPALSQTTRDHIEGLCNMLEIAAANPSPAHAGAGAEALASEIGELVEFQDGSREWTFQRDTLATFARRLAGGDHA